MIKHVLADGRILNHIEGYQVPYTETTEVAYRLLAEFAKRAADKKKEEKESA